MLSLLLAIQMQATSWVPRAAPPSGSEERYCANRSDQSWAVSAVEDKLVISPATREIDWTKLPSFLKPKQGERLREMTDQFTAVEVSDGFLVGNDVGEFGGWVAWRSKDGKKSYPVLDGNPIGFVKVGGAIAVVEGLGHLGIRRGSVHYISLSSAGRWVVRSTVDLGDVPYAFIADSSSEITIVTSRGVVQVTEAGLRHVAAADYEYLYPNSIAMIQGTYYVGMRHAISKLSPSGDGYSEQWLVPRDCESQSGPECQCVATGQESQAPSGSDEGGGLPNKRVNAPVQSVTTLAKCASAAPVRPARYARRYAAVMR